MKKNILFFLLLSCFSVFGLYSAELPYYAKQAKTAPIIDANSSDSCWSTAEWKAIDQLWIGPAADSTDFKGRFKIVWTPEKLYFFVEITDSKLNTTYPGNCNNIHNFDCIEIFLDEDHSGGNHQYTYNAFAYHIAANGDVCDNGIDRTMHLFNNDVESKFDTLSDNVYVWEVGMKVFNDKYVYGTNNIPDSLELNKVMGMSVAYNDNDNGSSRENMYGSVYIAGTDKNVSWINASYFGSLQLIGDSIPNPTSVKIVKPNKLICNQNIELQTIEVNYSDGFIGMVTTNIVDITGKTIKCSRLSKANSEFNSSLQLNGLPRGIYFLQLVSGDNSYLSKFLIN